MRNTFSVASLVGLAALLPAACYSQFVPAPTDLKSAVGFAGVPVRYKQVPAGICEQNPNVKSYSGYTDVEDGQHIFWWFFESRNGNASEAPLTVWINGGPGSSSMLGLFQELGPCSIDPATGKAIDNPYSWSNVSNMLFIDQPSTTGFSYAGTPLPAYIDNRTGLTVGLPSNECPDYARSTGTCGTYSSQDISLTANSTLAAAPNVWKTIQGFLGTFPQYSVNEFNFATESYGGHYGPVFNDYFVKQNEKNIAGAKKINLKTVLIGNGWIDPLIQHQAYYNFTVSPSNTYNLTIVDEAAKAEFYNNIYGPGNCADMLKQCYASGRDDVCSQADNFCTLQVEGVIDVVNRDPYDIRELKPDPFPYSAFVNYLNTPKVQQAIGAFVNFTTSSNPPFYGMVTVRGDDGKQVDTIRDMQNLLNHNVSVILFAGDADFICNWQGIEIVADEVNAVGYRQAGYANISSSDGIWHGQVKQSGLFGFVRIFEAGHQVPFYQPLVSLEMFDRAINHKDIATGKVDLIVGNLYHTTGPMQSTFIEGNSTVQYKPLPSNATYNTTLNAPNPTGPRSTLASKRIEIATFAEKLDKRFY